jgi:hypothetical protein
MSPEGTERTILMLRQTEESEMAEEAEEAVAVEGLLGQRCHFDIFTAETRATGQMSARWPNRRSKRWRSKLWMHQSL